MLLLIGIALSVIYYFVIFLPAQPINNFINNLPIGDVDSQKCNELIQAKNADFVASEPSENYMWESSTNLQDKNGYAAVGSDILDSKYLYSHKLCLALLSLTTYDPVTGKQTTIQIIDLGSNNAFFERIIMVPANEASSTEEYYLYGQRQNKPIDEIDIWSKIQVMP